MKYALFLSPNVNLKESQVLEGEQRRYHLSECGKREACVRRAL